MSGAATDVIEPHRASPRAVLWAVGFSVFIAADDLTVVSTMLRPIISDLGLVLPDGLDDAAWVVNAYLIAFVAVMPVAGRVSDVIGRRRTFLIAYLVFLAGTILIPLSTSLGPLLVGRVMTAIGGGAMVPVALAVVADVYPEPRRARALGTLGAIETMGWVWGPLYGAMLVRFLTWRWQFWLNIPLAVAGLIAVWWALAGHDRPARESKIDWLAAALLTVALVTLNLALLGSAEVQSVSGFDELRGDDEFDLRLLYPVAVIAGAGFVWRQRRSQSPLVDRAFFRGRTVRVALIVNFVVGAALVIAMVDVPLFVNAVEGDLQRSAVVAGWVLSALTIAMAVASYVGGRVTERTWYGPPIIAGLAAATVAYTLMGFTWSGDTPYAALALQLALLGAGLGMTLAPTTSAVVDHAEPDKRGGAASIVMVVRLLGLSVGLSALTAWGLARFNRLRTEIELPPLTDPGFEAALREASADLTADAIAETFVATAVVVAIGLVISVATLRHRSDPQEVLMSTNDDDTVSPDGAATPPGDRHTPGAIPDGFGYVPAVAPVEPSAPDAPTGEPDEEVDTAALLAAGAVAAATDSAEAARPGEDPAAPENGHESEGSDAVVEEDPAPDAPDAPGAAVAAAAVATGAQMVDTDEMPVFRSEPPPPPPAGGPGSGSDTWVHRHTGELLVAFGVVLLVAFGLIALLFARLQSAEDELDDTRADMERVEAGAALFASQVTGFQEQLGELSPTISEGLDEAIAGLEEFSTSTLQFNVEIDESVEISTEVVIDRTVVVPIETSIPINESFDTTIVVAGPFGVDIPLDVTVPVDIEVPVDLDVSIPINETVPISESIPVQLSVPIDVEIAGTQLATLADSLATGLESFAEIIEGLGA
ncbi:MAG: MFS transporter [Ilumatobacteraceae bacterium]